MIRAQMLFWLFFIITMGTNLAGYYSETVAFQGSIAVVGLAFLGYALWPNRHRALSPDSIAWVAFLAMPLVFMIFSENTFARGAWTSQIIVIMIYLAAAFVASAPNLRSFAGLAAGLVVIVLSATNLFEFLVVPNTWSISTGRAAGFLVNPNVSAATLVGYAALFLMSRKGPIDSADLLVVGLLFPAVASTFSRSGFLLLVLVVGVCYFLRVGKIVESIVVASAVLVLSSVIFFGLLLPKIELSSDAEVRLLSIFSGSIGQDFKLERAGVARDAWALFFNNFWTGVGVRSSLQMESGWGPHNMFAGLAMDFGIIGLLAYIPLLMRMAWRAAYPQPGEAEYSVVAAPVVLWLVVYGLFTHDLAYEPSAMILIAFAVCYPGSSATELDGESNPQLYSKPTRV